MISTYTDFEGNPYKKPNTENIIKNVSKEEIVTFFNLCCTIGGYIVFPAKKNNGNTINQERWRLKDRFDLTLECIRLWYIGEKDPVKNPLSDCLERYKDFFELFQDFKGYVEFFLLDDLVDKDKKQVRFWLRFESFDKTPYLPNAKEYKTYMDKVSVFIKARNARIDEFEKMRIIAAEK
jgi:hypothetical protein